MAAARERTIDVDGPLRVVEYGRGGPPVVCVHGLGGSAADWQLLAPRLAAAHRVVALDLPGFGVSPLGRRTATIESLRSLLDRFLHEHVGEPAVLLGNSMGGMLALLQAVRCPASVERLVLLGPVVPASVRRSPHPLTLVQFLIYALPTVGEWYLRTRRRHVAPADLVDVTLAYLTADPDRLPDWVVDERIALARRRSGDPTGDRAFLAATRSLLRLLATPRRYRRVLDRVAVPVLVVHGNRDRLVSPRAVARTATAHPTWNLTRLDDVGHLPQLEAADDVAVLIEDWLEPSAQRSAHFAEPR